MLSEAISARLVTVALRGDSSKMAPLRLLVVSLGVIISLPFPAAHPARSVGPQS
jgi:hypothetical protein